MQPSDDRQPTTRHLTVPEATTLFGTTPDAIRSRLRRGKLDKEVGEDGTVYVRLADDGQLGHYDGRMTVESTVPYINALKSQIELLADQVGMLKGELEDRKKEDRRHEERHAEELRRRDHLLAAALERIPLQLEEAPTEHSEAPEKPADVPEKGMATEEDKQPWWRFWS